VRVRLAADPRDPGHPRRLGVRVIEEDEIADGHLVAHVVARLVVADAVPLGSPVAPEVVDRVDLGLALDQPVTPLRLRHGGRELTPRQATLPPLGGVVERSRMISRSSLERARLIASSGPGVGGRNPGLRVIGGGGSVGACASVESVRGARAELEPSSRTAGIASVEPERVSRVSHRVAACTLSNARTGAFRESAVMLTRATAISDDSTNATFAKPRSGAASHSHIAARTSGGGSPSSPRASIT